MRKFSKITAVTLGGFIILGGASGAHAADYVTDAVKGLESSNVYISPNTSFPEAASVKANYDGASVGVVALPGNATNNLSANVLASSIAEKTDYDLIIVSIDKENDVYGAFGKNANSSEALEILNSKNTGDASETLTNSYQEIVSVVSSDYIEPNEDAGGVSPFLSIPLILAIITVPVVLFIRKGRNRKEDSPLQVTGEFSNEIIEFVSVYKKLFKTVNENVLTFREAKISDSLNMILKNTMELFKRIDRYGDRNQKVEASIHYADVLERLDSALSKDYYVDIFHNSKLWSNPQDRLNKVNLAIDMVNKELVENIKKVNASGDLDIKVNLMMIKSSSSSNTHKEIYGSESEDV